MFARSCGRHDRGQGLILTAITQSVGANRADLDTAELDTVIYVETPEGVLLELRPAGLPVRLYAFMLDAMFRAAILYALVLVLSVLPIEWLL